MKRAHDGETGHPDEFGDCGTGRDWFADIPKQAGILADLEQQRNAEIRAAEYMSREEEYIIHHWKEAFYIGNRANPKARAERKKVWDAYYERMIARIKEINEKYFKMEQILKEVAHE